MLHTHGYARLRGVPPAVDRLTPEGIIASARRAVCTGRVASSRAALVVTLDFIESIASGATRFYDGDVVQRELDHTAGSRDHGRNPR